MLRTSTKTKPNKYDYNLVVIGGGSAGLVSAYIGAVLNAKVALIEKARMGGDCLNTGCVPSKALIKSAKVASYIKHAHEYGLKAQSVEADFPKVMERVRSIIKTIEPHDSVERFQKLGVECLSGEAKIISPYEVQVGSKVLTTRNIIIATGARPLVPAIPGLDEIDFLTSENLWDRKVQPQNLVVLGGGPIGCELAQAFSRLGSKVSIIEMRDRLLGKEDTEVSELIEKKFEQEGVKVLISHKAIRFGNDDKGKFVICEADGRETRIDFDKSLIALGRTPNTTGFGLEELGLLNDINQLQVNEYLQTKYPSISACGDVVGPFQFTHTASHQAWFATVNSLFRPFKKFKVDYRVIPWCTFVDPEVARVGLSEAEAKAKGIEYEITRYHLDDLDRAITEGEDQGFVKVLTKTGSDQILGVTIVGASAGELISEFVSAMKNKIGLKTILNTIHVYPTLSEANRFAAGEWRKNHKSHLALKFLRWFNGVRR